nr:MAG TPA: Regulatory protein-modification, helix-turn-helix, transcriptional regulato, DNA [Caudoviricetes sp.]
MYIPPSDRMTVGQYNMMQSITEDILYRADRLCMNQGIGYSRFCKSLHIKPNTLNRMQDGCGYPSLPALCILCDALGLELYTRKKEEP